MLTCYFYLWLVFIYSNFVENIQIFEAKNCGPVIWLYQRQTVSNLKTIKIDGWAAAFLFYLWEHIFAN